MKRFLVFSSLLGFALCSARALAQMPPPPPPPPQPYAAQSYGGASPAPLVTDGPGNGLQLDLDVFGFSGSLAIPSVFGTTTTAFTAALPAIVAGSTSSVAAGYYFDQNAILVDLGFGATSGTNILFEVEPTYRRYFTPLRTSMVSPFAEGAIAFGILAPSEGSAAFGLGLGGAAGAEWLFTKNMGLEAAVTLGYFHLNEDNSNVDTIGLGGKIGLTIHL